LTQKGEMVERLQVKACSIGRILTNLEKKYSSSYDKDMKKSPSSSSQLGHPPSKRVYPRIQQIPPFNADRIKKSPSTEPTVSTPLEPTSTITEENEEKPTAPATAAADEKAKETNEEISK
jgi:hypothetical protein